MQNGLDYRYLKAFSLTAKYLNFSKAASELNIAQSAVSRQIKLLEESLGEQLIVRSSKKVLLTDNGKYLYRCIQRFDELTSEITKDTGPQLIKVGILHGMLENWFIKVISKFTKNTFHLLKVEPDTPSRLKENLLDGKYDLIFTTENIQSELITSLRLFEEKLVIISKKEIDLKKTHSYTWLTYSDSDFFFDLYKKHSKRIITVKSMTSIIKLVKENVGIAIVPSHTVKSKDKLFQYEVKGIKRPQIHLSTLNFQTMPDYINDFIHTIKDNVEE